MDYVNTPWMVCDLPNEPVHAIVQAAQIHRTPEDMIIMFDAQGSIRQVSDPDGNGILCAPISEKQAARALDYEIMFTIEVDHDRD